ncbi:alpha/beta hydrolase [Glaciecola sp. MH2013]|uniref:alpha/beta hydrolase n=1 Tax=Glaciecola sp. MH2013 TaxID=2785524 RepID=UPI0018A10515|nr:alpha/beta hydrolase [Glaciecola sp. MH2013]MBF7072116.1 alpha/beta hydrolase [Glaciecola sp. MH2013]
MYRFSLQKSCKCFIKTALLFVGVYACHSHAFFIENGEAQNDERLSREFVSFPAATKNTPYSEVSALNYNQADLKLVYSDEHADLYSSLWFSRDSATEKEKPLLVFIHGGCWLSAFDMSHSYAMATGLAQAGYTVLSLEYRRAGNGGEWPVALNDLAKGLTHALTALSDGSQTASSRTKVDNNTAESANNPQINTRHVVIMGHSAGGHLAAMLALKLEDILPTTTERVDIVSLAGIMDIKQYSFGNNSCQSATPSFMQGSLSERPQAYYLANPQSYTIQHPKIGKFLLLQGSADSIVPSAQAKHVNAQVNMFEGVGHFDWIHPGSFAFKQLLLALEKAD